METNDGKRSDHNVLLYESKLECVDRYTWLEYYTRRRTKEADLAFDKKFRQLQWKLPSQGANEAAEKLVDTIEKLMDEYYPLKLIRVKSTDDPWIDDDTRRNIRRRKRIFKKEGRSSRWKDAKKTTDLMIKRRKTKYYNKYTNQAKESNDPSLYYKIIGRLKDKERPPVFDISSLRPNNMSKETGEELADFFTTISNSFEPLTYDEVPVKTNEERISVTEDQVKKRLMACKKPKSMVRGDLFPSHIVKYIDVLVLSLIHI